MKSVLVSIQPKWCELIARGKKTIEVRKTRPKIETPFKCYIYQTKAKQVEHCDGCDITYYGNGKVIGEFVCDKIDEYKYGYCPHPEIGMNFDCGDNWWDIDEDDLEKACLSYEEFRKYADKSVNVNDIIYGWHISDLKIYDVPKELGEFSYPCPDKNYDTCFGCKYFYHDETEMCCKKEAVRPPQSWCYVEE